MRARTMIQARAWMGSCVLAVVLSGCGDSSGPGNGGGDLVSQQVSPEGGTVRSADGQLTLIFPAGAVTQTQTITIQPLSPSQAGSEFAAFKIEESYEIGPTGLALLQPVTVSFPADQQVEQPDGSIRTTMGLLLTSNDGRAEGLDSTRLEEVDGSLALRGELSHFSMLHRTGIAAELRVRGFPISPLEMGAFYGVDVEFERGRSALIRDVEFPLVSPVYHDHSSAVIGSVGPPSFSLDHLDLGTFVGTANYECEAVGTGQYQAVVEATPADGAPAGSKKIFLTTGLPRPVLCSDPARSTLTVTKSGSGSGTVTSNPAGIACGEGADACTEPYVRGTAVALTAVADQGSVFVTWSGACPGGSNVTTVVMDADKTCTAQFDRSAPVIQPLGSVSFPGQFEAAALDPADPNTLAAVEFSGRLRIYDITDPSSPRLIDSEDSFCADGVRSLDFADPGTFMQPTYVASSFFGLEGCLNTYPRGQTRRAPYDFFPGQIRSIPGTTDWLIPVFNGSFLQRRGMTGEPINIPLGPTARCSFGLTISGSTAFAVGQEGIPGTALADCQPGLSIVDLPSNTLVGSLNFGIAPRYVVISPDGRFAYVSDFEADLIHVINISTRAVEESFPVGDGPVGMAFTPDGSLLVTCWNAVTLELYDPDTGLLLTEVDLDGTNPVDVIATSDGAVVVFFGDEERDVGGGFGTFKINF